MELAAPLWAREVVQQIRDLKERCSQFSQTLVLSADPLHAGSSSENEQQYNNAAEYDHIFKVLVSAEEVIIRLCNENLSLQNSLDTAQALVENYHASDSRASKRRKLTENTEDFSLRTDTDVTVEQQARIRNAIQQNPLFSHLDDDKIEDLIKRVRVGRFSAHERIIVEGERGDCMYIIDSGEVDVVCNGEIIGKLKQGSYFGELALMYNCPRTATIIATSDVLAWIIDRVPFNIMHECLKKRALYEPILAQVPLLSSLLPYQLCKIADTLTAETYERGEIIVRQGEIGDKFYFIEEGKVECSLQAPDDPSSTPIVAATLSEHDYFGEISLLTHEPRRATVTAATQVRLLSMMRTHFLQVMSPVEHLLRKRMSTYDSYLHLATRLSAKAAKDKEKTVDTNAKEGENALESTSAVQQSSSNENGAVATAEQVPSTTVAVPAPEMPDFNQIIASEKAYISTLSTIVDKFIGNLLICRRWQLNTSEVFILASNFSDLLEAHKKLLQTLETPENRNVHTLEMIHSILRKYEYLIKCHYCGLTVLERRKSSPAFAQFLKNTQNVLGQDLVSLLSIPVMRFTYYTPFVNKLIAATRSPQLEEIAKGIHSLVRELSKIRDEAQRVYETLQLVIGDNQWPVKPDCTLLYEGELISPDSQILFGYLFSDRLLLAKPINCGLGQFRAAHYKSIPIQSCEVEVLDNTLVRLRYNSNGVREEELLRLPTISWLHNLNTAVRKANAD